MDNQNQIITPRHHIDGFFKYYTADSAKLTLGNMSRKWSTPPLFNDPFDNQFDLHFDDIDDKVVEQSFMQFYDVIKSPQPFTRNQFGTITSIMELIRQVYQANPGIKYTEAQMAYLRKGVTEGMEQIIETRAQMNADIHRIMADTSIFCVSETPDNLLMWSHYASNHTGVVVKFLSLVEVGSPLILAEPVCYTTQIPKITFDVLMDCDQIVKELIRTITLTKGEVWAYEKEWRIVATLRDKSKTFEILPYAPDEVGEVYLGCNINKNDKEEVIEIVRSRYSKAKVFQAGKHEKEYALVFKEIK